MPKIKSKTANKSYSILLRSESLGAVAVSRGTWSTRKRATEVAKTISPRAYNAQSATVVKTEDAKETPKTFTAEENHIHFAKLRDELGWRQRDFADYLGCAARTYQKWEYEEFTMPSYYRRLLIKALKYDGYLPPDWE